MAERAHNPTGRRLHLPIVGVTNGPGVNQPGVRKPPWLKVKLPGGPIYRELQHLMRDADLHTVCEEAMCPNIGECWEAREATFLLLGMKCTRRCGFCDVMTAKPDAVDEDEPARIAATAARMGLRYVVITGVARDDLSDGGAGVWADTIRACATAVPGIDVEVLPSDFKGGERDLATVLDAGPTVFAHNLETVPRLHTKIRPAFGYERSLDVLRQARAYGLVTKSNLILGLGETRAEVGEALRDLHAAGCDLVTITQYLRPTPRHHPVERWVKPEEFVELKAEAEQTGFAGVMSGPLVRSSYRAGRLYQQAVAARQTVA